MPVNSSKFSVHPYSLDSNRTYLRVYYTTGRSVVNRCGVTPLSHPPPGHSEWNTAVAQCTYTYTTHKRLNDIMACACEIRKGCIHFSHV